MNSTNPELKAEAIRLRIEERYSIKEISKLTGFSKSTLSGWLKPYPLTSEEILTKHNTGKRYVAPKKSHGEESKFFKVVASQNFTPQEKGNIAEAAVLFRLTLNKFLVFSSLFDEDRTDFIVQVPETKKILKLQVRYLSRPSHGLPGIMLTCTEGHGRRRRYQSGEFDFIVGYYLFNDTAYVYSFQEVTKYKTLVTISDEHAEGWHKLRC